MVLINARFEFATIFALMFVGSPEKEQFDSWEFKVSKNGAIQQCVFIIKYFKNNILKTLFYISILY